MFLLSSLCQPPPQTSDQSSWFMCDFKGDSLPWFYFAYFSAGFRWFGSLTNLSTRRPSQKAQAAPEHEGSLSEAKSVDDMESCSSSGSYVSSSHMYTHVGTVPRSETQRKTFRGQKEKKKKKGEQGDQGEGASGGRGQWKGEDHVRDSPLLSALASLSQSSPDRPLPSRGPPPTSSLSPALREPISSEHGTASSVGRPPHMAADVVSAQDVYVPMDRIVAAAHGHVTEQTERSRDRTGTPETSRTAHR